MNHRMPPTGHPNDRHSRWSFVDCAAVCVVMTDGLALAMKDARRANCNCRRCRSDLVAFISLIRE